jgi:hypothetical protein
MLKRIFVIGAAVLITTLSQPVNARHDTGAEFLTFGIGARASGMGEAFVAIADDPTSIYWNPAGLAILKERGITIMSNRLYKNIADGIYHNFLTYISPLKYTQAAWGIALNQLNSGSHLITKYNEATRTVETTGKFKTKDLAFIFSYAQALIPDVTIGINFKYILSDYYYIKSNAQAVDLGILYKSSVITNLALGLSLENLGTKVSYVDAYQYDRLPLNLRLGVSYKLNWDENSSILVAFDVNRPFYDNFTGVNAGIEWSLFDILDKGVIAARIGYFNKGGGWEGITYGFGVKYRGWEVDFASSPGSKLYSRDNNISLTKRF